MVKRKTRFQNRLTIFHSKYSQTIFVHSYLDEFCTHLLVLLRAGYMGLNEFN
jgi:hypothetical protein